MSRQEKGKKMTFLFQLDKQIEIVNVDAAHLRSTLKKLLLKIGFCFTNHIQSK